MAYITKLAFLEGGNSSSNLFNQSMDGGLSGTAAIKFKDIVDAGNSEERLKEKVSQLVQSQLPEFVASDYTRFTTFLEYYFKFLQKDYNAQEIIQNARNYADIDRTAVPFVEYFLKTYANDISENFIVDKKFLVKRIADLYESKGSDLSFKLLFKLFYNDDITIAYPYENILRVSDGVWEQRQSIFCQTVSGSTDDIEDRFLKVTINQIEYFVQIQSIKVSSSSITEFFLDPANIPPFSVGDAVSISDEDGIIYRGVVVPTTVSYRIEQAGRNFKVGQYFNIKKGGGVETTILITGVNSVGGITSFKFINYGFGFTSNFVSYLNANKNTSESLEAFNSRTNGFIEFLTFFEPHDISSPARYFDSDYVETGTPETYYTGEILATVSDSTASAGEITLNTPVSLDVAIITFIIGAVGKYPGNYISNKGFISDDQIRLEDDKLYQPFAYQISSNNEINKFYNLVIDLVHPAGTRLFNNRLISSNINLLSSLSVVTAENIFFEAHDSIRIIENNTIEIDKILSDTLELLDEDSLSISKIESDIVSLTEEPFYTFTKIVSDFVTLSDFLEVDWKNKNLYNNVSVFDALTFNVQTQLSDIITIVDSGEVVYSDYSDEDYFLEFYGGSTIEI